MSPLVLSSRALLMRIQIRLKYSLIWDHYRKLQMYLSPLRPFCYQSLNFSLSKTLIIQPVLIIAHESHISLHQAFSSFRQIGQYDIFKIKPTQRICLPIILQEYYIVCSTIHNSYLNLLLNK